jgi:hypothetical protein
MLCYELFGLSTAFTDNEKSTDFGSKALHNTAIVSPKMTVEKQSFFKMAQTEMVIT